jgi:hypothetical protein
MTLIVGSRQEQLRDALLRAKRAMPNADATGRKRFESLQAADQIVFRLNANHMVRTTSQSFGGGNADICSSIENDIAGSHVRLEELPIDVCLRIPKAEQEPECVAPLMRESEIKSYP